MGLNEPDEFWASNSVLQEQAPPGYKCASLITANYSSNAWTDPQHSVAEEVADMARRSTFPDVA